MATLILTAVGTAIGGPIGGAIGAAIGHYADQNLLFAPKARHGPRLGDLAVQTSAYDTPIPKIFGTMRVAGTVIWSTDLIESRSTSGGGKGRPRTVTYSYSASFAVALSARPIRSVGRIWADGKLLRGSAGDFKAATGFRLYTGDEDQPADPLIVSALGAAQTPAFRGIAYVVFENLRLEDFGNRIPSLTFEIEADPAPVGLGAIAGELSGDEIEAGPTPVLGGYAALGDTVRSAIEALAGVIPLSLADRDERLHLSAEPPVPVAVAEAEECGRREIVRRAASALPAEVSLAYYDPARDFQTGLQRATVSGPVDTRSFDRRALPAALSADAAKAFAEYRLTALHAGRSTAKLRLGWSRAALRPGDSLLLEGESGLWRIRRLTVGPMDLDLELQRLSNESLPGTVTAGSGDSVHEPDLTHGPTLLRLVELPFADPRWAQPKLVVAAAGEGAGWRRAELLASFDGGASWQEAGTSAAPAMLGTTLSALGPAPGTLFDAASAVEVELANEAMWLENASDDALVNGANLALLGGELVQFGAAQWLGGRRFRLSRLLRGRRGSEWAAAGHIAGEDFLLLDTETLVPLDQGAELVGGEVRVSALGVGDEDAPATASLQVSGEALRPPSPVHLRAERRPSGDINVSWVRRSRLGWAWASESETPLSEETERYRLVIAGSGFERGIESAVSSFVYTAAEQSLDGAAVPMTISVVQIGTYAASRPATLIFT